MNDIIPNSLEGYQAFGAELARSCLLGPITPSQGTLSLIAMREEGLSITGFKRKYQWIGTELSVRPNWMLADFHRAGGRTKINQADRDACDITFTKDGGEYRLKITWDELKDLPFVKDKYGHIKANWQNYRDDMLFARTIGKGLRRVAPELFAGMYTDAEARDFDSPVDKLATIRAKIALPEKPAPEPVPEPAEPVTPEVIKPLTCPIKGQWFGKSYRDIAVETPEIITALIKCDKTRHPELTPEHIAEIEAIAAEIGVKC